MHRNKKKCDWYFHLKCFARKNSKRAYNNTRKNCKSLKLDNSNAVTVGMTTIKRYLSICLLDLVWFARYCGKMYSRHLFSHGGLSFASGHKLTSILSLESLQGFKTNIQNLFDRQTKRVRLLSHFLATLKTSFHINLTLLVCLSRIKK